MKWWTVWIQKPSVYSTLEVFLAHYHCKTLHINTWPLMCFIRDHDSCNYCCYFISITDTIMKHNYLAVTVALLISASLHTVMLMPLINCHKTDIFSLLIVPVSFVKLPDFEARTLRPYLINPTWAMLVFLCDYKRDGRCSREITKCFCPPCTFFHFFGSCSGLTAQTFPAGKIVDIHNVKPRQPGERSVSCKFESHQHNNTKSRETDDPSVRRPPTFNFPLDHKCEQNIFQLVK